MLSHPSNKKYFKCVRVDGYELIRVRDTYLVKLLKILCYVQTATEICKYKICCYIRGNKNIINKCQCEVLRSPSLYSVFYMHELNTTIYATFAVYVIKCVLISLKNVFLDELQLFIYSLNTYVFMESSSYLYSQEIVNTCYFV